MNIITRDVAKSDLASLYPILETWIRDSETKEVIASEVEDTFQAVREAADGIGAIQFKVAVADGLVIGMAGLGSSLSPEMLAQTKTDSPAELRHFFVAADHRYGRGVGRTLFNAVAEAACQQGFKEIIVNSGPRYKDTAWGFYDKMFGKPVAVLKDYYAKGVDAPVWRKQLTQDMPALK